MRGGAGSGARRAGRRASGGGARRPPRPCCSSPPWRPWRWRAGHSPPNLTPRRGRAPRSSSGRAGSPRCASGAAHLGVRSAAVSSPGVYGSALSKAMTDFASHDGLVGAPDEDCSITGEVCTWGPLHACCPGYECARSPVGRGVCVVSPSGSSPEGNICTRFECRHPGPLHGGYNGLKCAEPSFPAGAVLVGFLPCARVARPRGGGAAMPGHGGLVENRVEQRRREARRGSPAGAAPGRFRTRGTRGRSRTRVAPKRS